MPEQITIGTCDRHCIIQSRRGESRFGTLNKLTSVRRGPHPDGNCGMRAAINLPTTGTIPEPCNTISATRTSSTPSDTPSSHPTGSATSGAIRLAPDPGSAHLKRAWMCARQTRPPGRGDCWILKIAHAPSPKNLSKNGFAPERGWHFCGGCFCKKKLSGAGEDFDRIDGPRSACGHIVTVRTLPATSVVGAKAENIGLLARNALISRNSALLREQNYGSAVPGASLPPAGSRNSGGPLSILLGFLIRPVSKAHLDHDGRRTASPQPRAPA